MTLWPKNDNLVSVSFYFVELGAARVSAKPVSWRDTQKGFKTIFEEATPSFSNGGAITWTETANVLAGTKGTKLKGLKQQQR